MVQSTRESRKTQLSIERFWERGTSAPRIQWEKWRIQVKQAICKGEHNVGHATSIKTNKCTTTGRAKIRNGHRGCNRSSGTESSNPQ